MKLYNKSKNLIVSNKLHIADTFFKRLAGLILEKSIGEDEALLITKCYSIHTYFMSFPIDAVFLDKNFKVIEIIALKPWRFSKFYNSEYVAEFNYGYVYDKISIGDILEII